jgi:hypothetical protein
VTTLSNLKNADKYFITSPSPSSYSPPPCRCVSSPAAAAADYMKKPQFLNNFWEGFKEVLGRGHVIKSLDK